MNRDHLMRQSEILPEATLDVSITVIGAGAIGSFTVLALAKMGFEDITVYDFDTVSVENMSCQWYRFGDIGKPKVQALQELVEDFTRIKIEARNERFEKVMDGERGSMRGIIISAVDSMSVRRDIWETVKRSPLAEWVIDPRMASEYALSFVMNPRDEADVLSYEKTLYSDESAVQERCTAKATMYTATMIAGYVAKHVKDLVTGSKYARVTHWDIKENQMLNWPKREKIEAAISAP